MRSIITNLSELPASNSEHVLYGRIMRYGVAGSALKHGISYRNLIHLVRSADYLGTDESGLLWWIGRTSDNEEYEVAGIFTDDGAVVIIHAMPMKWRRR